MKRIIPILFIFILSAGLTGCYKDVVSPGADPNGPPQFVSFSGDLVPVFTKNCAMAGCHSDGAKKPYLTPDKAYNELMAGGYINQAVPESSPIYTSVKPGGSMPTLNPGDLSKLRDWLRNGAPNN